MAGITPGTETLVADMSLKAGLSYAECVAMIEPGKTPVFDCRLYPDVMGPATDLSPQAILAQFDALVTVLAQADDPDTARAVTEAREAFNDTHGHTDGAARCGQIAIALETSFLEAKLPFEESMQLAHLIACLTDRAVLGARHEAFNGFVVDLADIQWDPRKLAAGLVRIGALPKRDPRAILSYSAYKAVHDLDVRAGFAELVMEAQAGINSAKSIPGSAYGRTSLRRMMTAFIDAGDAWLDSPEGLELMRHLARLFEAIGMNLHMSRKAPRAAADRYLATAAIISRQRFRTRRDLCLNAAGYGGLDVPTLPALWAPVAG
jgi:hypothetical protein